LDARDVDNTLIARTGVIKERAVMPGTNRRVFFQLKKA
jgi:hypothetical protein